MNLLHWFLLYYWRYIQIFNLLKEMNALLPSLWACLFKSLTFYLVLLALFEGLRYLSNPNKLKVFWGQTVLFFALLQSLWQCLVYHNDNKYLLMNLWSSWWLYLLGIHFLKKILGTSLAVQWLRCYTSTAGAWVWSLVGELRSPIPHGQRRKKKNFTKHYWWFFSVFRPFFVPVSIFLN